MIREFVSRRGGSLLMLGGRRGLADGGWGATSVAEVLPARLPMLGRPKLRALAGEGSADQHGRARP